MASSLLPHKHPGFQHRPPKYLWSTSCLAPPCPYTDSATHRSVPTGPATDAMLPIRGHWAWPRRSLTLVIKTHLICSIPSGLPRSQVCSSSRDGLVSHCSQLTFTFPMESSMFYFQEMARGKGNHTGKLGRELSFLNGNRFFGGPIRSLQVSGYINSTLLTKIHNPRDKLCALLVTV